MNELFSPEGLAIFLQVMGINLVLSGDNAIVIGLAASGLPPAQRNKVILFGILAATVLRVIFAIVAVQLLDVVGLLLAGGILLLWVCWKMWRDLRTSAKTLHDAEEVLVDKDLDHDSRIGGPINPQKTFAQAAWTIVIADVSMSLDNVLAVAGASREYPIILVAGLIVSVLLMGLAATVIARLLQRFHWLAYVGLAIILYVALEMIYHGSRDIWWPEEHAVEAVEPAPPEAVLPGPTPTPVPAAP